MSILITQQSAAEAATTFDWISLIPTAVVAALIAGGINIFWEKRKLSRSEKAQAYASFLQATSKRWRAFGDRDGAVKRGAEEGELVSIEERLSAVRDDQWGAYAMLQIVGSSEAVKHALSLIKAFDERNRNFKNPEARRKNIAGDKRTEMQNLFVAAARKDMGLRKLDKDELKSGFEESPRNS